MPNGRRIPSTNTSRSCAPPVFFGSRSTRISPDPVSARKISLFGATVRKRGILKPLAYTLTVNPAGGFGSDRAGGYPRRRPYHPLVLDKDLRRLVSFELVAS